MNRLAFRYCFPVALLAASASVSAIGLGELRGQPALGERLQVEIGLLGGSKDALDASCYRLVQPAGGGDLPWLKKATLTVKKGSQPVLEVKSEIPLREPILQFSIHVACGNDVSRDYVILASPARDVVPAVAEPRSSVRESFSPASSRPQAGEARPVLAERVPSTPRPQVPRARPVERADSGKGLPDRLMLSTGIDVGEPSLRLATGLIGGLKADGGGGSSVEAQREVLRLEYRMLMALYEQASTQMATAEKLRNMEATLAELEQRTVEVAQRSEKGAAQGDSSQPKDQPPVAEVTKPVEPVVAPVKAPTVPAAAAGESDELAEWGLYGLLAAVVLVLGGFLGWRNYRERYLRDSEARDLFVAPELEVDPKRDEEREELGGVDLHVEPAVMGAAMKVDVELDGESDANDSGVQDKVSESASEEQLDSVFSVNATTLDEHFEANPVMELADIMLSFGRVKGAAQALQEYIDNNPQEALQPWIRLMDVYKMAGMRNEFEAVALNLNQNFNVEIQQWDGSEPSQNRHSLDLILDDVPAAPVPVAPRPECLEDMPRIMASVTQFWSTGDVVGYLYQLLRDNRGGKRVGFALPVVEEILFLIELKETSNRLEREVEGS